MTGATSSSHFRASCSSTNILIGRFAVAVRANISACCWPIMLRATMAIGPIGPAEAFAVTVAAKPARAWSLKPPSMWVTLNILR